MYTTIPLYQDVALHCHLICELHGQAHLDGQEWIAINTCALHYFQSLH